MNYVTLKPKSSWARRTLVSATTDKWKVLEQQQEVSFSSLKGPWLHVVPDTAADKRDHAIWVSLTEDKNFEVVK